MPNFIKLPESGDIINLDLIVSIERASNFSETNTVFISASGNTVDDFNIKVSGADTDYLYKMIEVK